MTGGLSVWGSTWASNASDIGTSERACSKLAVPIRRASSASPMCFARHGGKRADFVDHASRAVPISPPASGTRRAGHDGRARCPQKQGNAHKVVAEVLVKFSVLCQVLISADEDEDALSAQDRTYYACCSGGFSSRRRHHTGGRDASWTCSAPPPPPVALIPRTFALERYQPLRMAATTTATWTYCCSTWIACSSLSIGTIRPETWCAPKPPIAAPKAKKA
eukprot:scaffold294741_cov37-Tisochrysis_lutea.AAC.2